MTHEFVGLQEVAKAAGKSLSTVNRNLSKLRDYGARKDDEGIWHVPITAIEGVGWHVKGDISRDAPSQPSVTSLDMSHEVSDLRTERDSLREELTALHGRLSMAEAAAEKWQLVAAERLQNLDDLRRSQRLLEVANSAAGGHTQDSPAASRGSGAGEGGSSLVRRLTRFRRS